MATLNLTQIQAQISAEVDQSATAPTVGATDWNIRAQLINRAQTDWAESYDWEVLKKVHNGVVSTSTGNASYVLPSDFRKIDGFPRITWDGTNANDFSIIDPTNNQQYTDTDKYVNILANATSYVMYIHATSLSSGASVQFTYYSSPASLSTTTATSPCPDGSYLTQRALYYMLRSREDGRFPEAKAEADRILARLIENENTFGRAHDDNRIHNWNTTRYSFRIGRD